MARINGEHVINNLFHIAINFDKRHKMMAKDDRVYVLAPFYTLYIFASLFPSSLWSTSTPPTARAACINGAATSASAYSSAGLEMASPLQDTFFDFLRHQQMSLI